MRDNRNRYLIERHNPGLGGYLTVFHRGRKMLFDKPAEAKAWLEYFEQTSPDHHRISTIRTDVHPAPLKWIVETRPKAGAMVAWRSTNIETKTAAEAKAAAAELRKKNAGCQYRTRALTRNHVDY